MSINPNPDRIPITRSVSYAVTGAPELPAHGAAIPGTTLAPNQVTFTYQAAPDSQLGRIQARVKGFWRRDGGRVNPGQPMAQHYFGDLTGWPEWLAEEARLHDPEASSAVSVVPPATNQAALLAEDLRYVLGCTEPRHAHEKPGVWDTSGEPCGHCARLTVARQNLAAYDAETEAGQAGEEQPETPLEKRLRYSERRNDELRAESLRRGKVNLEYAEKIVALERQIDEVRGQLGAEILRAGQAEAELRRLAAEAPRTETPDARPGDDYEATTGHAITCGAGFGMGCDCGVRPTEPETVHACPPDGSGLTPCCGRTPFELPRTDRISSEATAVTCQPAVPVAAPPTTEQEAHRLALSEALGLGTGAPWDAIHDRATELGLPPLDQDPVARRLGLLAAYRATLLTEAADAVFALDYDVMVGEEGDENLGSMREAWDLGTIHAEKLLRRLAAEAPHTETPDAHSCGNCEGIDPDSCLTNLDRPAVKAQQGAAKTPDEAPGQWCKCPSCWGWFVEDHPGEDLDELGGDLSWWSGLPEHRDAPAVVAQPGKETDRG